MPTREYLDEALERMEREIDALREGRERGRADRTAVEE
jgi:hypothetical protein